MVACCVHYGGLFQCNYVSKVNIGQRNFRIRLLTALEIIHRRRGGEALVTGGSIPFGFYLTPAKFTYPGSYEPASRAVCVFLRVFTNSVHTTEQQFNHREHRPPLQASRPDSNSVPPWLPCPRVYGILPQVEGCTSHYFSTWCRMKRPTSSSSALAKL